MSEKLGLHEYNGKEDHELTGDLIDILQLTETDMTIFFRRLADIPLLSGSDRYEDIPETLQAAGMGPGTRPAVPCSRAAPDVQDHCS